nr:hypothetical protein [uncultured Psychroserpens sp.]
MHRLLTILVFIFFARMDAQNSKAYVIDGVLYDNKTYNIELNLDAKYIYSTANLTDSKKIIELGFHNKDTITFITTQAFNKRSDSIRNIPSTDYILNNTNKTWYKDNVLYSGPFINYYYNGIKKSEGTIINGKVEGVSFHYHTNGIIKEKHNYKNSYFNGTQQYYFNNGNIKKKGDYKNGKRIGTWEEYFINGNLSLQYFYNNSGDTTNAIEYYSNGKVKRKLQPYIEFQNIVIYKDFRVNRDHYHHSDYLQGKIEFRKKEIKQLRKKLNKLDSKIKSSIPIDLDYLYRGILYGVLNDRELSIRDFKNALELEPLNYQAQYLLLISLIHKYLDVSIEKIPVDDINYICSGLKDRINDHVHKLDVLYLNQYYKYCEN